MFRERTGERGKMTLNQSTSDEGESPSQSRRDEGQSRDQLDELTTAAGWLRSRPYYQDQLTTYRTESAQEAQTGTVSLSHPVESALQCHGITDLYEHQVRTVETIRAGDNVVVATPTASGKSLTYLVPILESSVSAEASKALYIAPSRALINDQEAMFRRFGAALETGEFEARAYTGTTGRGTRRSIKDSEPTVVLMTPDMVHQSILRYGHSTNHWRWLASALDYIILDEIHQYRGVFGSHVSLVARRLNRLCEIRGSDPQYICCSATIGNPVDHAATVTGKPCDSYSLIDKDTSASGPRHWALWNPPHRADTDGAERAGTVDMSASDPQRTTESPGSGGETPSPPDAPTQTGTRRSRNMETLRLFCDFVREGYQTLVFTDTRQQASQYVNTADKRLRAIGEEELADAVAEYHAGLRADDRLDLEVSVKTGETRGVWATRALELGIDIGELDVVILNGYPGTTMQTFQRAGRAGRGTDPALVILVGGENPLDQRIMADSTRLFEAEPEDAVVNPSNQTLLRKHLVCAADESFLRPTDQDHFGDMGDAVQDLTTNGTLVRGTNRGIVWDYAGTDNIHRATDIRSISDRTFELRDTRAKRVISQLGVTEMLRDAHPGAIFTHQKQSYRVTDVDLTADTVSLSPIEDTTGFTTPIRPKELTIEAVTDSRDLSVNPSVPVTAGLASVSVSRHTDTYLEYQSPQDSDPVEHQIRQTLPVDTTTTDALYLQFPPTDSLGVELPDKSPTQACADSLHALEHAVISLFPTQILCDRRDVGGLSTAAHDQLQSPTVFVHDGHEGGANLVRTAYPELETLLKETYNLLQSCDCTTGCPACVLSPQCGNNNRHLSKHGAIQLLADLFPNNT